MSEQMIDFEALEDVRQANVRDSQYQLKRLGEGRFNLSPKGKMIIGYDATQGVNVKAGAGVVVIGCLPKDDPRCTHGLLNGVTGRVFTSNVLEAHFEKQGLEGETYDFTSPQDYNGVKYFKITPVVESEETPAETQDEAPVEEPVNEAEAEASVETENIVSTSEEDF